MQNSNNQPALICYTPPLTFERDMIAPYAKVGCSAFRTIAANQSSEAGVAFPGQAGGYSES
jgi:hypothetical protein